jgi:hypothetical protein
VFIKGPKTALLGRARRSRAPSRWSRPRAARKSTPYFSSTRESDEPSISRNGRYAGIGWNGSLKSPDDLVAAAPCPVREFTIMVDRARPREASEIPYGEAQTQETADVMRAEPVARIF